MKHKSRLLMLSVLLTIAGIGLVVLAALTACISPRAKVEPTETAGWTEAVPTRLTETAEPPDVEDLRVLCEQAKVQQVILNLLDNAAEHCPPGSETVVVISADRRGIVRVRVTDQGSGVPPEALERVFESFFTTRKGGTGLGTSIVRHIVENHGGLVTMANNDPPPGCTVEFSLPRGSRR